MAAMQASIFTHGGLVSRSVQLRPLALFLWAKIRDSFKIYEAARSTVLSAVALFILACLAVFRTICSIQQI